MEWAEVLNDPLLRDLPYKIELNEWGQIVMSPASNKHGILQGRISQLLGNRLPDGVVITECSIATAKGVKVADAAWCSKDFLRRQGIATPFVEAPEICIEIVSPSNSTAEMGEKCRLYLDSGAQEVWIVTENGVIEIHDRNGLVNRSAFGVSLDLSGLDF